MNKKNNNFVGVGKVYLENVQFAGFAIMDSKQLHMAIMSIIVYCS